MNIEQIKFENNLLTDSYGAHVTQAAHTAVAMGVQWKQLQELTKIVSDVMEGTTKMDDDEYRHILNSAIVLQDGAYYGQVVSIENIISSEFCSVYTTEEIEHVFIVRRQQFVFDYLVEQRMKKLPDVHQLLKVIHEWGCETPLMDKWGGELINDDEVQELVGIMYEIESRIADILKEKEIPIPTFRHSNFEQQIAEIMTAHELCCNHLK